MALLWVFDLWWAGGCGPAPLPPQPLTGRSARPALFRVPAATKPIARTARHRLPLPVRGPAPDLMPAPPRRRPKRCFGPAGARCHEAHDRMQHAIGCHGVLPVHAELTSRGERHHHGAVLVRPDPGDFMQPQRAKPRRQQFLRRGRQAEPRLRQQRSLPAAARHRERGAQRRNGRTG